MHTIIWFQVINNNNNHYHHVVPPAQISLTLSRHFSLSFITSSRSSGLHPVSPHSCCMYVLAGRPALARPYVGVHRSTSLISSSLLLQQCPACLVHLFVSVQVVHPYSSIDMTAAWKKLHFILSVRSDFHMTDSLSIAVHAFVSHVSMSFSVDEIIIIHSKQMYLRATILNTNNLVIRQLFLSHIDFYLMWMLFK